MPSSVVALEDNHQTQITRYLVSTSSILIQGCFGIPVALVDLFVWELHGCYNVLLCNLFNVGYPMEHASTLLIFHLNNWII